MSSGWWTIAASFVALAVHRTASSSFSLLLVPLQQEFGASRAIVSLLFTAHMVVYGFASLLCGIAIQRFGPRVTIVFGGVLIGLGMIAMASAHSLATMGLGFGLLCGGGVALIGRPANFVLVSERFPTRVATAMGLAGAGTGIGVLCLIPAVQLAADRVGWRQAFAWSGVAAAVLVALAMSYRRSSPGHPIANSDPQLRPSRHASPSDARAMAIVLSPKWQAFAAANGLMGAAMFGLLAHHVALLSELGWSAMAAATSLGIVQVVRSASGPLWGVLIDRSGRRLGYGLSTAVAVAGLVAVGAAHARLEVGPLLVYLFIVAFGIGSGGTLPTIATLGNELFSKEQRAVAWGFLETAYAAGAALGAFSIGSLFDRTGNYLAGLALVALELVGSYLFVLAVSPRKRAVAAQG
jgi:MFS family permease